MGALSEGRELGTEFSSRIRSASPRAANKAGTEVFAIG
jgi:hypothetical protein